MIACLTPADFFINENISTLNYANKASYISNKPVVNEDPNLRVINTMKIEVTRLKGELLKAF